MSSTDFSSSTYKPSEHQVSDNRTGINHLHDATEDLASETFQEDDGLLTVEDNKEKERSLSETHLNIEEGKDKPSWLRALKTRLTLLHESPLFLAFVASLSITMNRFIVKILSREYSVFQILSIRSIGALAISLITMFWKGIFPLGPKDKIPLLLTRGTFGAVIIGCTWTAISLLPLSEVSFLRNSHPIVTAILASLTGMEKLSWMTWLGIGGTAIGNALVAHPPFISGGHQEWGTKRIVGLVVSVISVLLLGSNAILVKKIGKSVHPFVFLNYQLCCSLILSIPFLSASYPMKTKLQQGPLDLVLLFVLSILAVSNQGMIISALQRGSPTLVNTVLMTNMIYSSLLGVFVLSERFSAVTGSGAFIILISVLLVVVGRGLSKKQEHKSFPENEKENELGLELVLNDFNQSTSEVDKEP